MISYTCCFIYRLMKSGFSYLFGKWALFGEITFWETVTFSLSGKHIYFSKVFSIRRVFFLKRLAETHGINVNIRSMFKVK